MMPLLAIASLLFLSVFAFYEAPVERSILAWRQGDASRTAPIKAAGWILLGFALLVAVWDQGWARGIPVWLGVLMMTGLVSLVLVSWRDTSLRLGVQVSAGVAVISLLGTGVGAL